MRDYDYDDDDVEVSNHMSGYAETSFQAGAVHGNIHSGDVHNYAYDESQMVVYFKWPVIAALAAGLFVVSTAYARVILDFDLTAWDWTKLALSTVLVVPVFFATEATFHADVLMSLRYLIIVVVIAVAFNQGRDVELIRGLSELFGNWLIWRF